MDNNFLLDNIEDVEHLPLNRKEALRDSLITQLVDKARNDFFTYVKLMAPEIIPEGFVNGKHIEIICSDLQEIEASILQAKRAHAKRQKKKAKRAQYLLPPGGMKSKLISILFVTWFFGRNPDLPVLQLGHSTKFCIDNFGSGVLDVLTSDRFKTLFPNPKCRVKRSARAKQSFQLEGGGKYYTTGAGSKIAGRRAALLISDDVISEQEAYSDKLRNGINNWYIPGARSRMLPYGAEVIVNTRWHLDDLSGFLDRKDAKSDNPWKIIKFPAILDAKSAKMLGLKEGDSFWPELWPVEVFHEFKQSLPPSKFSALYMQNPIPDEGNIINEDHWQVFYGEEPMCDAIIVSLDTAFSQSKRADYSAYTVWGVFHKRETGRNGFSYIASNALLLGAEKGRWSFPQLLEKIEFIMEMWNPDYYLIENKASGQSLLQELQIKQLPVVPFNPGKDDKEQRAHASVPTFMAKRIHYPEDESWAKDVIAETCEFPHGAHDDLCDTVWQFILWMRTQNFLVSEGEIGYEDGIEDDSPKTYQKAATYWGAIAGK